MSPSHIMLGANPGVWIPDYRIGMAPELKLALSSMCIILYSVCHIVLKYIISGTVIDSPPFSMNTASVLSESVPSPSTSGCLGEWSHVPRDPPCQHLSQFIVVFSLFTSIIPSSIRCFENTGLNLRIEMRSFLNKLFSFH